MRERAKARRELRDEARMEAVKKRVRRGESVCRG